MKNVIYLILIFVINISSNAQNSFVCGTKDDAIDLDRIYAFSKNNVLQTTKTQSLKFIPIQVHSIGRDDSTGHITSDYILQQICTLNEQFEPVGMYFYLINDIKKIYNSTYYEHDYFIGYQMMISNNVSGVLNIYIASNVGIGVGGYYLPSGDALAIRIDETGFGKKVWAHEVGHYFGLPHTFNGLSGGTNELVDGSNCASAGDGFCDTPADPNDFSWNCPYSGITTDANGALYTPDKTLYMSYAARTCVNRFSTEQINYMNGVLNSSRSFLLAHPIPDTIAVTGDIVAFSPASEEADVDYNVNFSWNRVVGAEKYNILVSKSIVFIPGINLVDETVTDTFFQALLNPDDYYFWKIVPFKNGNVCAPYTSGTRFFTGFNSGIVSPVNTALEELYSMDATIKVFPNPISSNYLNIDMLIPTDASFEIFVYDMQGRLIVLDKLNVKENVKKQVEIDVSSLVTGVFLLKIKNGKGEVMHQKIIRN